MILAYIDVRPFLFVIGLPVVILLAQLKRYVSCECFPGHDLVHDPFPFGGSNAISMRSRSDNAEESGRAIDRQGQGAFNVNAYVFPDWCV